MCVYRLVADRVAAGRSVPGAAAGIAAGLGLLVLAGCNTVEGLGDDLKGASQSTREVFTGDSSSSTTGGVEGQGSSK